MMRSECLFRKTAILSLFSIVGALVASNHAYSDDSYWTRYFKCLTGKKATDSAVNCEPEDSFITSVATSAAIVSRPTCATDKEFFTGTGISIDLKSCGNRPGCAVEKGTCAPPGFEKKLPKNGFVYDCKDCCNPGIKKVNGTCPIVNGASTYSSKTCKSCPDFPDQSGVITNGYRDAISRVQECFAKKYPNPKLLKQYLRGILEMGMKGKGASTKCTEISGVRGAVASYNSSTNLFEISYELLDLSGEALIQKIGHESFHATGFDNQKAEVHNSIKLVKVGDGTLANIRYDRVYACERLCFGTEFLPDSGASNSFISKEECELCLGEPGSPQCSNLMPRDEFPSIDKISDQMWTDIFSCDKTYPKATYVIVTDLLQKATDLTSLEDAFFGESSKYYELLKCQKEAIAKVETAFIALKKKYPNDKKNGKAIEKKIASNHDTRTVLVESLGLCLRHKMLKKARSFCEGKGAECQQNVAKLVEKEGLDKWDSPEFLSKQIKKYNDDHIGIIKIKESATVDEFCTGTGNL